jgi:hypothetical protein
MVIAMHVSAISFLELLLFEARAHGTSVAMVVQRTIYYVVRYNSLQNIIYDVCAS